MISQTPRHRVFVSFHHEDEVYKNIFVQMMGEDFVDESVKDGDIDPRLHPETIRQKIRDEYIRDASVTVVLIGSCTWQRRHVDWEIGASLRHTQPNPRCGLLGILLPNHPDSSRNAYDRRLVPPRLAVNADGDDPFARMYKWSTNSVQVREWIDVAFQRRGGNPPNNRRVQFRRNRRGDCSAGWQS